MKNGIIKDSTVSVENKNFYSENGYLIGETIFLSNEIEEIKSEIIRIFRFGGKEIVGYSEPASESSDEDLIRKYTTLNFPHKISDVVLKYLKDSRISNILTQIIGPNVKCMQSMLFIKGPGKKGQSWHQDEYYIPTRDKSLTGAWIALDNATVDNGCLWIIPGSNKDGYIRKRIPINREEFQDKDMSDLHPFIEKQDAVPVELNAGSVLFFHGYLLHGSMENKTKDHYRRALVNHYMSAESLLTWSWDGKDPIPEDHRDIVMVAGKDPYKYKGYQEIVKPMLRPDVLEGKKKWY